MSIEFGSYIFNSLSFFLALCTAGGFLISIYLYQYKNTPGTGFITLLQIFTSIWAAFYFLEYSATELSLKLFWSKLSYLGIPFTPIWFYLFSLKFNNRDKYINPKLIGALVTISVLIFIVAATNDYHHLNWQSAHIDTVNNTTIYKYGPFFWITFTFFYTLLFLGIINIFKLVINTTKHFHLSLWFILLACLIPITGNFMYVFKINPIPGFDWTPASFLFSGAILAYINHKFSTFDIVPFARKKIFDFMEDGIIVIDDQKRIVDVNQSLLNLINRNSTDVLGKGLMEVFPNRKELIQKIEHTDAVLKEILTTELTKDSRNLDMTVTPLRDKNGVINGRMFVFRDITQRVQYAEELKATNEILTKEIAEKEKLISDLDAFAHTVAHDLRDSVGAISTSTEFIQMDIEHKDFDSAIETSTLIGSTANKLLHVIQELLTMATIRQQDIVTTKVKMGKAVEESEKRLHELIKNSKAKIIKPEKWPVAHGNQAWLEEIWVNYISNAIKYGGDPPVIELGAEQLYSENKVKFWVKDNGNGITPEAQKKLFKKYTRLEASRVEGTGLGLSIVKRIVEKLGGEVGVFSSGIKDEGSLFYFTLPAN